MKKFIFRLETVLRIRKTREGALKRDLEYAHQKWSQNKNHEAALQGQIEALSEEILRKRVEGKLDFQDTYSQILDHLNASLQIVQQNVASQQKTVEAQQKRFHQAIQERKLIEKIKEKHYAHWRTSEIQTEGALLDEIGCRRQAHLK